MAFDFARELLDEEDVHDYLEDLVGAFEVSPEGEAAPDHGWAWALLDAGLCSYDATPDAWTAEMLRDLIADDFVEAIECTADCVDEGLAELRAFFAWAKGQGLANADELASVLDEATALGLRDALAEGVAHDEEDEEDEDEDEDEPTAADRREWALAFRMAQESGDLPFLPRPAPPARAPAKLSAVEVAMREREEKRAQKKAAKAARKRSG
jgi:hypothetical protein